MPLSLRCGRERNGKCKAGLHATTAIRDTQIKDGDGSVPFGVEWPHVWRTIRNKEKETAVGVKDGTKDKNVRTAERRGLTSPPAALAHTTAVAGVRVLTASATVTRTKPRLGGMHGIVHATFGQLAIELGLWRETKEAVRSDGVTLHPSVGRANECVA